jgi:hypothetical protein
MPNPYRKQNPTAAVVVPQITARTFAAGAAVFTKTKQLYKHAKPTACGTCRFQGPLVADVMANVTKCG